MTPKILFCRAFPTKLDSEYNRSFVGNDANLLKRQLYKVGIDINQCEFKNIFHSSYKIYDGKYLTDFGIKEFNQFEHYVNYTKPTIIAPLGEAALNLVAGKKGIKQWRGSVLKSTISDIKCYPTFEPAEVIKLQNESKVALHGDKNILYQNILPIFQADLERIKEQSTTADIPKVVENFEINLSYSELIARIRGMNKHAFISCDIETLPSDDGPLMWMIGFATSSTDAFVVPIVRNGKLCWTPQEEFVLWNEIQQVFQNLNTQVIFQRHQYDLAVLAKYYGLTCCGTPRFCEDSQWLYHAIYPTMPKSLAMINSLYTWRPYYKGKGLGPDNKTADWALPYEVEAVYNCRDTTATFECYHKLRQEAKANGHWSTYNRTMQVAPAHLNMTTKGVKIDQVKKDNLIKEYEEITKVKEKELFDLVGFKFNYNSPKQLQELFYVHFKLPVIKKRQTGKPTCDTYALKRIKRNGGRIQKVVEFLEEVKLSTKLCSTYANMALCKGRAHTTYTWVNSFRTGSSSSPYIFIRKGRQLKEAGTNLQNIPKRSKLGAKIRTMFIPDEGYVWLKSDYAQIEARFVAYDSEDLELIAAIEHGADTHWLNTLRVFQFDAEYDPKRKIDLGFGLFTMDKLRFLAKTIKHATNYRMGPFQLQDVLLKEGIHFTTKHCKQFINQTKESSPALINWQNEIEQEVRSTRTLTSYLGDKKVFLGRMNDSLIRSAISFKPQSSAGRLLQETLAKAEKIPGFTPLINVHDEIDGQIPKDQVDFGARTLRQTMEDHSFTIKGRTFFIPADIQVGPSWGELTDYKEV